MKSGLLAFAFLLLLFPCSGQQQSFTFNFTDDNLDAVFRIVEQQTGYRFFYKNNDISNVKVTANVTSAPIDEVMGHVLQNTGLHFVIDPQKNIFITRIRVNDDVHPSLFLTESTTPFATTPTTESPVNRVVAGDNTRGNKIYEVGNKLTSQQGKMVTITGVVVNNEGQPVIGASVQSGSGGAVTGQDGSYSLRLPSGRHELVVRSVGIVETKRTVLVHGEGVLDIEVPIEVTNLREVMVEAEETSQLRTVKLGVEKLNIAEIKNVPTIFGEADVLRVVLTLPGVKSVGEASTGFNVRGGATDQNLILYNDATIYNPSHFFGFFSAFNPETVENVELYKSTLPARYGGRVSSVLQVTGKNGNDEKVKGSAGIGFLTSRFTVEGPISKGKNNFIVSGRKTYSNWIFNLLPDDSGFKGTKAEFHDLNLSLSHRFNSKNDISFTGYISHDESNLNTDTVFRYNNRNFGIKWNHDFSEALTSYVGVGFDHYDYRNSFDRDSAYAYSLDFAIDQQYFKTHFTFTPDSRHTLTFGLHSILYGIAPADFRKAHPASVIQPVNVENEKALETAIYLEEEFHVSKKILLNAGLRYSVFNYLGPQSVNIYAPDIPRSPENIIDTVSYKKNDLIQTYQGLDLRLSGRYSITDNTSIKVGFTTARQFIHMLSNTIAIAPTDTWKLSDANIKPQFSQQVSAGVYRNFFSNKVELSVEGYVKRIENYLDYKSGANLLVNENIETEVFTTLGNAYGIETMVRKPTGNFNGWMSYTYSRTFLKMDDEISGENINKGDWYPASYDKPHDFTFVGNQKLSRRFSISMNTTYSTGRPVTIPIGVFYYGSAQKTLFSNRNGYRVPDYFRIDLSVNIEGNHKIRQLTHNSWTIGIYNLTGQKNPYSIYFVPVRGVIQGYKLSIFGAAIPFVNYNIRF